MDVMSLWLDGVTMMLHIIIKNKKLTFHMTSHPWVLSAGIVSVSGLTSWRPEQKSHSGFFMFLLSLKFCQPLFLTFIGSLLPWTWGFYAVFLLSCSRQTSVMEPLWVLQLPLAPLLPSPSTSFQSISTWSWCCCDLGLLRLSQLHFSGVDHHNVQLVSHDQLISLG